MSVLIPASAVVSGMLALLSDGVSWFVLAAPVCATAAVLVPVVALSQRSTMRFEARGLYTSSSGTNQNRYGEWVPFVLLDRFEVRRWTPPADARTWHNEFGGPRTALSVRLLDGRYIELPFRRGDQVAARWRPMLLVRLGGSQWANPVIDDAGSAVRWDGSNDSAFADVFNARLSELRAATAGLPPAKESWQTDEDATWKPYWLLQDVHRQIPPSLAGERRWVSEALDGSDPPVPLPAASPLPPRPKAPDPAALPATWTGLELPARYWTLASERAGSVLGKRSSMVISAADVTFDRRWRPDLRVPLADIDRFDIVFERFSEHSPGSPGVPAGNWRLLLLVRDGEQVKLSGLDHGYFKQNRLFWSSGNASSRLSEATGSMAWPNEQPLLVAARLNAHLESARQRSASKRNGSIAEAS